jgi:DNA (cytosine-5)-methyltransferase 1
MEPTWYEFFAGGGMARIGLGDAWKCTFANEWSEKKASTYSSVFGSRELMVDDVAKLSPKDLPGSPQLVWASFPCQDLSLAGNGEGLNGARSGTFKTFWKLLGAMFATGRRPRLLVLENVMGAITSHGGKDFEYIVEALTAERYQVGALVIDALHFVPQSRKRLFIIGMDDSIAIPEYFRGHGASELWSPASLRTAYLQLPDRLKASWVWWNLPVPNAVAPALSTLIEEEPTGVEWHSSAQTDQVLQLMSPLHLRKLEKARLLKRKIVGTLYRRTRRDRNGTSVQRAEVRFDQVSGCLRTPAGGSSRQTLLVVEGEQVRSRLLSPREAARLMGVPDSYPLPSNYNDAYHLFGDGLVVPVVSWLGEHLLKPLVTGESAKRAA